MHERRSGGEMVSYEWLLRNVLLRCSLIGSYGGHCGAYELGILGVDMLVNACISPSWLKWMHQGHEWAGAASEMGNLLNNCPGSLLVDFNPDPRGLQHISVLKLFDHSRSY